LRKKDGEVTIDRGPPGTVYWSGNRKSVEKNPPLMFFGSASKNLVEGFSKTKKERKREKANYSGISANNHYPLFFNILLGSGY
jgi:hypothetical protein